MSGHHDEEDGEVSAGTVAISSEGQLDESEPENRNKTPPKKERLTKDERNDLVASLEHIVVVGSHARHTIYRTNQWIALHNQQDNGASVAIAGNKIQLNETSTKRLREANIATLPHDLPPRMLHAEDVRLYGNGGFRRNPCPSKKKLKQTLRVQQEAAEADEQWQIEHGDGIHPVEFSKTYLSSFYHSLNDEQGTNIFRKQSCTVQPQDVPRAMLLRCWDRAMHAASSAVTWKQAGPDEDLNATSTSEEGANNQMPYQPQTAKEKCQRLQIELPGNNESKTCPNCGITFDLDDQLQRHYYGTLRQRGCCWPLIYRQECELMNRVLQKETSDCAEELVHLVLSARLKEGNQDAAHPHNAVWDWRDIMRIIHKAQHENSDSLTHQHQCDNSLGPTLQTLITGDLSSKIPLVLNQQILQAVRMRLIERYADLPK